MTNIIITLFIVFYRIPLINILGDKGMGYYSVALVIYLFLMTCVAYGMPNALSIILTEQHSKGQYQLLYKTVKSSLLFAVLTGVILTLIVFFGADIISTYLMNASYSSYAIRAFSLCLLPVSVEGVLHGIYYGTKLAPVSARSQKIEKFFVAVLSIIGAVIFANIGNDFVKIQNDPELESAYSAMGASLGFALGVLIACLYMLIYLKRYIKRLKDISLKDKKTNNQTTKNILRTIMNAMLPFVLTLIIFHISSFTDYAIFNRIMSVQGHKENSYISLLGMLNGKYEFFISLPLLIVSGYASSTIPQFRKIVERGNKRKMQSHIGQILRYTMMLVVPCTAFYMIFATPLMNLFFTGDNNTPALLLRIGAVSIIFYSLAAISNAVLNVLDNWAIVAKNAFFSLIIQVFSLLLMMIIFQWGIVAVVISRIIFSAALYIFNENSLRERTDYVQEYKRTFSIPVIASLIMSAASFLVYFILDLFFLDKIAVVIAVVIGIFVYIMSLVFLGGITQREMYRLPFGKILAPLCRKLRLVK